MKLWDLSSYAQVETPERNWANISETFCTEFHSFWQVGLLDVILLECMSQQIPEFHKFNFL